ncbi:hypothetical protein, partial [Streptomyces galilaeus]|uniref:hypothetical protein n=1 Tax=Streptomyces galilaeus TaxID=33899 RepID=UPI0038F74FCA
GIYANNTRGINGQILQTTGTGVQWVSTTTLGVNGINSANAPLVYNSGTGVLSINQSSSLADGYLSSTDWNTFNNKQNAITAGTGLQ